jgi:hypothetical protein
MGDPIIFTIKLPTLAHLNASKIMDWLVKIM